MRVDFPRGVTREVVAWLEEYVGPGANRVDPEWVKGAWFYERRFRPYDKQVHDEQPTAGDYIPTITVKDPKLATLFALRWSGHAV